MQLQTQIRHLISTGSLKPGMQLPTVRQLAGFLRINRNTVARALASLRAAGCDVACYDRVRVEPTDASFEEARRFAVDARAEGYVSIGGGSVIDTCKAAIAKLEDQILEFMEQADASAREVAAANKVAAQAKKDVDAEVAELGKREENFKSKLAELQSNRAELAAVHAALQDAPDQPRGQAFAIHQRAIAIKYHRLDLKHLSVSCKGQS